MAADRVERHQPAKRQAARRRRRLVEIPDRREPHDEVGCDDPILHHAEQIAAAAGKGDGAAAAPCVAGERDGLLEVAGVGVRQSFHASAPRILSRVIGRSFMRRPIALEIAFATAAGPRMIPDSPTVLAPNGP